MAESSRWRHAACIVCRRSKIRCDSSPNETKCKRCVQLDCECIRPEIHAGRQKGIKNKRVGLDKALYQLEQAVKRTKTGDRRNPEDDRVVSELKKLLGDGYLHSVSPDQSSQSYQDADASSGDEQDGSNDRTDLTHRTEENLAIDDAENPLQLLARASYFQPINEPRSRPRAQSHPHHHQHRPSIPLEPSATKGSDLQEFFTSARVKLDIGEDLDPIDLGLLTMEEADSLFSFFHANLAHTRWGLDPRIYTLAFTRSRSAFLFTSILAASALFNPTAAALSKRLCNHVRSLAIKITSRRYKSVEVVLAFLVNIPWMFPGQHSSDDETCAYISMATSIAVDLSLHKVIAHTDVFGRGASATLARGECIDPRVALSTDGFSDVDPRSEQGILLLRSRERCWISLFVLERGVSLARGRPFIVPITRSLKDCDNWHRSAHADPSDSHLVSMAVLRRQLDELFTTVRALCDGSQMSTSDGSLIAQSIESAIERFFDQWYAEWGMSIGSGPNHSLPPYVEILVTHTRLSTYGGVINHPTAPLEVRRFFRTAGLSSALSVMRVCIQGESQLQSMPNNTAIMISFAACFALALTAYASGGSSLAPSIRKLIDETADVLERIGTATEHRNGLSSLYGRYLRQIVRSTANGKPLGNMPAPQQDASLSTATQAPTSSTAQPDYLNQQLLWPEPLQFSAMSNDQIMQVLNQPGNDFGSSVSDFMWDDMNSFDWVHWPEFSM